MYQSLIEPSKIAWSRMGCIAYITADGKELHIATLRHRKDHGTWELHLHADPTLGEHISKIYRGRELANLLWNPSGLELVVADVFGRLSVCTIFIATNRLLVSKVWPNEPENQMNAMVGSMWLNIKKVVWSSWFDECVAAKEPCRSHFTAQRQGKMDNGTTLPPNTK